jgi:hypothetical protein
VRVEINVVGHDPGAAWAHEAISRTSRLITWTLHEGAQSLATSMTIALQRGMSFSWLVVANIRGSEDNWLTTGIPSIGG